MQTLRVSQTRSGLSLQGLLQELAPFVLQPHPTLQLHAYNVVVGIVVALEGEPLVTTVLSLVWHKVSSKPVQCRPGQANQD